MRNLFLQVVAPFPSFLTFGFAFLWVQPVSQQGTVTRSTEFPSWGFHAWRSHCSPKKAICTPFPWNTLEHQERIWGTGDVFLCRVKSYRQQKDEPETQGRDFSSSSPLPPTICKATTGGSSTKPQTNPKLPPKQKADLISNWSASSGYKTLDFCSAQQQHRNKKRASNTD